jgi:hypothetical protein
MAGLWIGYAQKKLKRLKAFMAMADIPLKSRRFQLDGVTILVKSKFGSDEINIWAEALGGIFFICHVGEDTGANGYTKNVYKLKGDGLVELASSITSKAFSVAGLNLIDDGKYFLDYDLNTYDDPDDYDYNFNPTGLVAEDGSGTAISKISGKNGRFALNQSFEEEFFRAYVNDVDGTDRSYLVLDDSLTFRPYKIKGNPVFNRYTDDSITYLHSRTKHDPSSLVLRNDMYNAGIADGFGDSLLVINKLYDKKLALDDDDNEVKTEKTINDDANGAALYGATRFYLNKQTDQDIGRVKTFAGGANFAEPAVREVYGAGATEETFHRADDQSTNTFFMRGNTVYGSDKDPGGHIKMPPNFPHLANDIKLPYTFTDEGLLTYVRMQKNDAYTTLNTGLYVAGQLIEESGIEDVLVFADGTGGVADSTTGRWIAENNGPIVVKKTAYTILHAHHDENFDAVLYKKTVYKADSDELLPYRQLNILGDQLDPVMGQIKKTLIESESTYYIVVNGVITQLKDSDDVAYSYTSKEYTLTAQTVADGDGGHPQIFIFQDLPWVDIDNDGNRQITRIFTTATDKSLLFGFDVWDAKSKHDVVYNDSNPAYKYLWSDYDTSFTAYPPLVDLEDIEERKWLMFDVDGESREIIPPKEDGIDYKRINGLLMVNA